MMVIRRSLLSMISFSIEGSDIIHIFFRNCCHPVWCSVSISVQGKTPGKNKNDAYKAGGYKNEEQ